MAKGNECPPGHSATLIISGIVLIVLGVLWITRVISLDQTFALLLIGWGLKKLIWAAQGGCYYC